MERIKLVQKGNLTKFLGISGSCHNVGWRRSCRKPVCIARAIRTRPKTYSASPPCTLLGFYESHESHCLSHWQRHNVFQLASVCFAFMTIIYYIFFVSHNCNSHSSYTCHGFNVLYTTSGHFVTSSNSQKQQPYIIKYPKKFKDREGNSHVITSLRKMMFFTTHVQLWKPEPTNRQRPSRLEAKCPTSDNQAKSPESFRAKNEASALSRTNLVAVAQCRDQKDSWTTRRNKNVQVLQDMDDKYITKNWKKLRDN